MKPTVVYKLRMDSKWLVWSAVMMGIAFFVQAFDFIGLRMMQGISIVQMIVCMILPMLLEAAWCVIIRGNRAEGAKICGIIGAALSILLCVQTILGGGIVLILIGCGSCLLAGAMLVLVTWGFIPYRHLGFLVLAAVVVIRVLLFGIIDYVATLNWTAILLELPIVCILASVMFFFGGIYPMKKK